jgi:hypothetical protein
MFCAAGLSFSGTVGVMSRFHVLRARTRFWRYLRHRVPISCFALPDTFSAVPTASGPVFMFCTSRLIFDGTEGVGSRFHVLRPRTHFRWYRGRRVPFSCFRRCGGRRVQFSCFALPDSFSAVSRALGLVFMFCAPGHVFGGVVVVKTRFHLLRFQSRFLRFLALRVPITCFASPHLFSAVPRASGLVLMSCAPELIFGGIEGVGSRFNVLSSRTSFRRYRRLPLPFSCFTSPDSFSAVPRASGPIFMFCGPGLVFGDIEGVGSRFHVLHFRTRFRWFRGRRVPFSCFASPYLLLMLPRASGPIFMFSLPDTFSAAGERRI